MLYNAKCTPVGRVLFLTMEVSRDECRFSPYDDPAA